MKDDIRIQTIASALAFHATAHELLASGASVLAIVNGISSVLVGIMLASDAEAGTVLIRNLREVLDKIESGHLQAFLESDGSA